MNEDEATICATRSIQKKTIKEGNYWAGCSWWWRGWMTNEERRRRDTRERISLLGRVVNISTVLHKLHSFSESEKDCCNNKSLTNDLVFPRPRVFGFIFDFIKILYYMRAYAQISLTNEWIYWIHLSTMKRCEAVVQTNSIQSRTIKDETTELGARDDGENGEQKMDEDFDLNEKKPAFLIR